MKYKTVTYMVYVCQFLFINSFCMINLLLIKLCIKLKLIKIKNFEHNISKHFIKNCLVAVTHKINT